MNNETTASPKPKSPLKQSSMRKRPGLLILLVAVLITSLILSHLFISLLISGSEIEITASKLQSDEEYSTDYTQVTVDLILYNPGRQRGTTVWVEITDQPTDVSFSKTQYVQIDYKEVKNLTFNFTLDKLIYKGEFSYRTWLTYPNSQD